jgi:hypothetical protein
MIIFFVRFGWRHNFVVIGDFRFLLLCGFDLCRRVRFCLCCLLFRLTNMVNLVFAPILALRKLCLFSPGSQRTDPNTIWFTKKLRHTFKNMEATQFLQLQTSFSGIEQILDDIAKCKHKGTSSPQQQARLCKHLLNSLHTTICQFVFRGKPITPPPKPRLPPWSLSFSPELKKAVINLRKEQRKTKLRQKRRNRLHQWRNLYKKLVNRSRRTAIQDTYNKSVSATNTWKRLFHKATTNQKIKNVKSEAKRYRSIYKQHHLGRWHRLSHKLLSRVKNKRLQQQYNAHMDTMKKWKHIIHQLRVKSTIQGLRSAGMQHRRLYDERMSSIEKNAIMKNDQARMRKTERKKTRRSRKKKKKKRKKTKKKTENKKGEEEKKGREVKTPHNEKLSLYDYGMCLRAYAGVLYYGVKSNLDETTETFNPVLNMYSRYTDIIDSIKRPYIFQTYCQRTLRWDLFVRHEERLIQMPFSSISIEHERMLYFSMLHFCYAVILFHESERPSQDNGSSYSLQQVSTYTDFMMTDELFNMEAMYMCRSITKTVDRTTAFADMTCWNFYLRAIETMHRGRIRLKCIYDYGFSSKQLATLTNYLRRPGRHSKNKKTSFKRKTKNKYFIDPMLNIAVSYKSWTASDQRIVYQFIDHVVDTYLNRH